ncbi:DUF2187 family protein [Gottfriedia sp. NPDC057948]|uniref:DUF2187 family protein n=1 Tax=Gottfriedia sp. NPDC057948 TaxID=3346287 RepID=UPI0036DAC106
MILKTKKIAKLGNHILFKNGIKGSVEKVNEYTVIVNITENKSYLEFEGNRKI